MNIVYPTPLRLEWGESPLDADDIGTLLEEYRVIVDNTTFTVPAGFRFGPSIPKFVRSFVSVSDCLAASCVHDWFYRTGIVQREYADKVFRQMVDDRAGSWRARRAYVGVRVGGEGSYMDPKWDDWREENGFERVEKDAEWSA